MNELLRKSTGPGVPVGAGSKLSYGELVMENDRLWKANSTLRTALEDMTQRYQGVLENTRKLSADKAVLRVDVASKQKSREELQRIVRRWQWIASGLAALFAAAVIVACTIAGKK